MPIAPPLLPETLSAGAVRLRPLTAADGPALMHQLGTPGIARWLAAIRAPFTEADARELLDYAADPAQNVRALEAGGALIGCLSLGATLWYWLDTPYQGQGHMSRALRHLLPLYFRTPAPDLIASCREDNTNSAALLRRLGFVPAPDTRRRFFHAEACSHPCREYRMSRARWLALDVPPPSA
ncbi:GNAT family N-acetyltransferase [Salipiger sp. P9]|uniref:GNAT family N-acetyltransferase n=1 Tax=Salipiger pentaromativorans TaxID=2943193 RepID=UPI002158633F|nr:GNAT family N-acetyltransferase [Salipiger pentaromativorans]MCR8550313.1 GNAT family N-acetyltransferase [Salipiger pentaromativorans]